MMNKGLKRWKTASVWFLVFWDFSELLKNRIQHILQDESHTSHFPMANSLYFPHLSWAGLKSGPACNPAWMKVN